MKYLITLKPLEPFFFGKENTFGEGESANYFAKSSHFPQQSTILGMIRKEMLKSKGYLTKKLRGEWVNESLKADAKEFIGDTKFSLNEESNFKENNLGIVKSISPIFLEKDSNFFIAVKNFFKYNLEPKEPILLRKYNAKEEIQTNFFNIKDFSDKKSLDKIFEKIIQVGNKKVARAGKKFSKDDKNKGFFKRLSYNLKDDFRFAFEIEIEDSKCDLKKLDNKIVFLGAERGKFLMRVKNRESISFEDIKLDGGEFSYAVLLSDSYIKEPLSKLCDFAITSETTFRFLQNNFKNGKREFKKSGLYYFYEKGSVFINPNELFFTEIKKDSLTQIGYNKFIKKEAK